MLKQYLVKFTYRPGDSSGKLFREELKTPSAIIKEFLMGPLLLFPHYTFGLLPGRWKAFQAWDLFQNFRNSPLGEGQMAFHSATLRKSWIPPKEVIDLCKTFDMLMLIWFQDTLLLPITRKFSFLLLWPSDVGQGSCLPSYLVTQSYKHGSDIRIERRVLLQQLLVKMCLKNLVSLGLSDEIGNFETNYEILY